MKVCSQCGIEKDVSEFGEVKTNTDGLNGKCKECINRYQREYYENNKEKKKEYYKSNKVEVKEYREKNKEHLKEYYENNKCEIKKQQKEYRKYNKDKIKEKNEEYYKNNKDKIKENKKEYYRNNKEKYRKYCENNEDWIRIKNKEYYQNNKKQINEVKKIYKEKNKEFYKEYYSEYRKNNRDYSREYQEVNKDRLREYSKKYYKTPQGKEVSKKNSHKRRALKNGNGGEYTLEEWKECLEFFDNRCAYTGLDLTLEENVLNIDHIIPLTKSGTSYIWNLCPSEEITNKSKHNSILEEWYKKQEYFSEERLQKIYKWQEYAYNTYNEIIIN